MKLALGLIFALAIYTVILNYYYRNISKKVLRKLDDKKEIALTFDDGPDTRYTPLLLDLLYKNGVKATFFLVTDKVLKNKDIFNRIINEGHTVGLHSLYHRSAWLSFPWHVYYDFRKSLELFDNIGFNIKLFRPPWGTFNLLTQHYADMHGLKTILWTFNTNDWSPVIPIRDIKHKLLKNIKPGSIILFHDSSKVKGVPDKTIAVLAEIIPCLKEDGYEFVTLDKIGGKNEEGNKGSIQ